MKTDIHQYVVGISVFIVLNQQFYPPFDLKVCQKEYDRIYTLAEYVEESRAVFVDKCNDIVYY